MFTTTPEASGPALMHSNQDTLRLASNALAAAASANVIAPVTVPPPM